jgi:tRNA wybutosine-synthesizing protein 3
MSFQHEKQQFLKKPDKSLAQGIDKAILKLCNIINKKPDYYTTSSCAGRIVLMPETGKKQERIFSAVFHEKINFNDIKRSLPSYPKTPISYIKHEPCIMHVACRTLENASKLVEVARNCGWKKSGIINIRNERVMCELNSNEILATPIADKGKIIVPEDYLKILVKEANKKLDMTREKIKNLEKALK